MAQQKLEQDVCQLILASSCGPVLHHVHTNYGFLIVKMTVPLERYWPGYVLIPINDILLTVLLKSCTEEQSEMGV